MSYVLHLAKQKFKFAGTHFTIFGPQSSERLHGHNYQLKVMIEVEELDKNLGFAFDFNEVKPIIQKICDELDEYVLIPENSPYVNITKDNHSIDIVFADKAYKFPQEDVRLLPLVNITTEELARYCLESFLANAPMKKCFISLAISIEETQGQSVTYSVKL